MKKVVIVNNEKTDGHLEKKTPYCSTDGQITN